jgi:hypothetical protein
MRASWASWGVGAATAAALVVNNKAKSFERID